MATTTLPAPKPRFFGGLVGLIEALRRRIAAANARARDRDILRRFAEMDDSLLADVGLTRDDLKRIAREVGAPF
ncbi:hypothetical protein [Amaricoccus sp.]|uniref:hypothetical protein n=1 Tax=Amaricoccus sp. TaxID=1872485 RepID=UPI001B5E1BB9|nr:hypothetical protein [Amaricoccus sp.]MBP7243022.1 hypothetical protein [Amaricoccus sp.]